MNCSPLGSFVKTWDFPGKNIGVGCYFLLQGIFLTQGSNIYVFVSLPWQAGLFFTTEPPGMPIFKTASLIIFHVPNKNNNAAVSICIRLECSFIIIMILCGMGALKLLYFKFPHRPKLGCPPLFHADSLLLGGNTSS